MSQNNNTSKGRPHLPSGIIVMWSGAINDIPNGWTLCDGTNGTPDLTNRFILGTNNDVGATGGSDSITLSTNQLPEHFHEGETSEIKAHTHSGETDKTGAVRGFSLTSPDVGSYVIYPNAVMAYSKLDHLHTFTTDSAGKHNHTFETSKVGSNESIDIKPPYYKLAFIMKL